jgi:nucleotide-binding universal stress UspA family protein
MYQSIVVGVTHTETAMEAARRARQLAEQFGARLDIVTAYAGIDDLASPQRFEAQQLVDGLSHPPIPSGTHGHARSGDPAEVILLVAKEVGADLVVVGNKGMRGAGRVLGSVPNKVAHKALCSVLIVNTT